MQILQKIDKCPDCGEPGQKIKNETVLFAVKKSFKEKIGKKDFSLCRNPDCETGYFNNDINTKIHKNDFKRPIWFKTGADPVIICYCKNIKEEDIIKTVVKTGLDEINKITFYLKNSLGENCRINNPTGHCCSGAFKDTIKKGLLKREELSKTGDKSLDSVKISLKELDKKIADLSKIIKHNCNC
ncbi:MAG: (2Fe-2S)-binding protein [Desulforegulaceae bacterium]|nr:(2Fe-2S)-binding protein [Desulforegulaceae bacterium]